MQSQQEHKIKQEENVAVSYVVDEDDKGMIKRESKTPDEGGAEEEVHKESLTLEAEIERLK